MDERDTILRCVICGVSTGHHNRLKCESIHCKLTFNIVAKMEIRPDYGMPNGEHAIQYKSLGRAIWNEKLKDFECYVHERWYIFPSREVVEAKYKEVIAKDYLLERIKETEFSKKFKNELDKHKCNPCQYRINKVSYEKFNAIFNTRGNNEWTNSVLPGVSQNKRRKQAHA